MDLIATIVGFNLAYMQRSICGTYIEDSLLLISEIHAGIDRLFGHLTPRETFI